MKTTLILSAAIAAIAAVPASASERDKQIKAEKRFAKQFREVVQPLQYDGDYSPAAGRQPEPEATPTTPVRFIPKWKREIPVIVAPAPRYVDPAPPTNSDSGSGQQEQTPTQNFQQQPAAGYLTSTQLPAPEAVNTVGAGGLGAGSATGSTAYPDYSTALPTTAVGAPAGAQQDVTSRTVQTTTTRLEAVPRY